MDEALHNLDSTGVVQHFNSLNLILFIPCSILTVTHIHQQCTQWNYKLYISLKTPKCFGTMVPSSQRPGTSLELMLCYACSSDVKGELTLNSMAQIHTSVTLLMSRDLAWSSGRLKCQHASQISAVAHISWDVMYMSSALQTLPVVSRNGGNAYWKSAPTDLFIW